MSKNRPVNAVTANFKTNMRQMTEVSQRKKKAGSYCGFTSKFKLARDVNNEACNQLY